MAFTIKSTAFTHEKEIPSKYTCEGEDLSPALSWYDPPKGTMAYALIVDDPDAPDPRAPKMTWVHWILYNLPTGTQALKEGVAMKELPQGTEEGINDWGNTGYGGPCPPIGRHRYYFKLYALSKRLTGIRLPTKKDLEKAMAGSILAQTQMIGTYEKRNK
ncbi:MAG: YbhB/YbcL family Raf kinase inhibitor-like protein [Pseudomonadota bacterium]